MNFKTYLIEREDIYGFDAEYRQKKQPLTNKLSNDTKPVESLISDDIITELNRFHLGTYFPSRTWNHKVQWGENVGSIECDISPLGSYKLIVRKLSTNLVGESIWCCKKVIPLADDIKEDKKDGIAQDVMKIVESVNSQELDSPSNEYKNFRKLSQSLAIQLRLKAPTIFIYEGAFQIDENYSLMRFSYRGAGQEAANGRKCEEFNVHIKYDKTYGVISCCGNEISSGKTGQKWVLQPSDWNEYFLPSQPISEIVECVVNAFKTY